MFGIFGCADCDRLAHKVDGLMKQNNKCHDTHKREIDQLKVQITGLTVKLAEFEMSKTKLKKDDK